MAEPKQPVFDGLQKELYRGGVDTKFRGARQHRSVSLHTVSSLWNKAVDYSEILLLSEDLSLL